LDIDLMVTENSFLPQLSYRCRERFDRLMMRPVYNVVDSANGGPRCLEHHYHCQSPAVAFGSATEHSVVEPVAKVPEILRSDDRVGCPSADTLFHR
jgi:hypothetical protein